MASVEDYARLSAAVYATTPSNAIDPAGEWQTLELQRDHPVTGFAAGVFRHRGTGEVVIAYAGTGQEKVRDWVFGNIPAALGEYSPQVAAAMELYVRTRQRYGDNISFTGHSLGGGLASLMAVYFDRPATVFAPAPFELSATRAVLLNDYAQRLRAKGLRDAAFEGYIPIDHFAERERNVEAYTIAGDVVLTRFGRERTVVDPARDRILAADTAAASAFDLHSLVLNAAALGAPGAAARSLA